MIERILAQPEPDGESIAETVRERLGHLTERGRQPTLPELDEIARLYQFLAAHIIYIERRGRA